MNIHVATILDDSIWERFSYSEYVRSEDEILNPALIEAGYNLLGNWYSSERDSFGPLARARRALTPEGRNVIVWYG